MKNLGIEKQQTNLFFNDFGYSLPKDHDLVKLSNELPWEELVEEVSKCYSSTDGAKSKPIRMMIGLEIVKIKYGFSDEELVEQLQSNIAIMYFCGLKQIETVKIASSSMTHFRNRLTKEVILKLQDVAIKKIIRKLPRRKINSVVSDSTVIEENISYPTDTNLLSTIIKKGIEIIEKTRKLGNKVVIKGKKIVKSLIRGFNLKRKKTKKEIKSMKGKLIKKAKYFIEQTQKAINKVKNKIKENILNKWDKTIEIAKEIIKQQKKTLEKGKQKIEERIVSLFREKVRAIFRGKDNKKTEFGNKINMNLIGGKVLVLTNLTNNNISDTKQIGKSIDKHKEITGKLPIEYCCAILLYRSFNKVSYLYKSRCRSKKWGDKR